LEQPQGCVQTYKNLKYTKFVVRGVDTTEVLGNFQVRQGHFPCKYLGLPLRFGKTKREDEQLLIDKVTWKLPRWKGKLLNKTGRLTLINSILSVVVL
jgi:hypothetical protein